MSDIITNPGEPNFSIVMKHEGPISLWMYEINRSPTLRDAVARCEQVARKALKLRRSQHVSREMMRIVFIEVVGSESVAEVIHQGRLTFDEVYGLREQQIATSGAVCGSLGSPGSQPGESLHQYRAESA